MYCNPRTACGTDCFYCPVNLHISKQVPMCQNVVKEMLSGFFYKFSIDSFSYKALTGSMHHANVI